MAQVKIAPSILSADILHLEDEIRDVEAAGADWLHIDIMDGHFVPNLSFGPGLVRRLARITRLPLDVHLMIANPQDFIASFAEAGADNITVHSEVAVPLPQLFEMVKSHGKSFGVSLKPDTSVDAIADYLEFLDLLLIMTVYPGFGGQEFMESTVPKIARAHALRSHGEYRYEIEVDGGLNGETAKKAVRNGAEIIVAGEHIFNSKDYKRAIELLRV